ncbi:MAG: HAD-IIB family hydrolase [Clostridiaceae bacterium]|nr:HAD-IIB family hydrolase [Clostridiaceae bacterium]
MKKFDGVFIVTDMDGTLLDEHSAISAEDSAAIDYFIDNGGLFSVATGRAKRSVEGFVPELRTSAPSIVYNGSLAVDLNTGLIVKESTLGQEGYNLVEDVLQKFPSVGVEICLSDEQYVARNNFYTDRHHKVLGLDLHKKSYKDIAMPWLKLTLAEEHEVLLDVMEHVCRSYKDSMFAQFSMPYYYEVMALSASKGDSATWLMEYLGVPPDNFYTIGDGLNDLELIRASGSNSYAPANASELILKNAANVLSNNNGNAIAELIGILDLKY